MNSIQTFADSAVIKDATGKPILTMGHILAGALGVVGLYFMIPERKRKSLFK